MTKTQGSAEWAEIEDRAYADRSSKGFGESAMFRAMISASENADMTSVESGFEIGSERWYRVAITGYEELLSAS